jgi:hypothetical protein
VGAGGGSAPKGRAGIARFGREPVGGD